jgi:hypothetical protein
VCARVRGCTRAKYTCIYRHRHRRKRHTNTHTHLLSLSLTHTHTQTHTHTPTAPSGLAIYCNRIPRPLPVYFTGIHANGSCMHAPGRFSTGTHIRIHVHTHANTHACTYTRMHASIYPRNVYVRRVCAYTVRRFRRLHCVCEQIAMHTCTRVHA